MRTHSLLAVLLTLAGCGVDLGGGPTLDEMNAVTPTADPTIDATPAAAPYEPGQRRDVGGADAVYDPPGWAEYVERVTLPGDLDGDGIDDLVLSGWIPNAPDTVPCEMGCPGFSQALVRIVYGSHGIATGHAMTADADLESLHVSGLRSSVGAAGDVDGDGHPDLFVSIGTSGCEQGSVYLVRGGTRLSGTTDVRDAGSLLRASTTCTGFGDANGVGDVDGDGVDDFTIAAQQGGRVYLYYGAHGEPTARRSELDAAAAFLTPDGAPLGRAIAVGDVDGDGRGDFVLGVDADERDHSLWLVLGRAARFVGSVDVSTVATRIQATRVTPLGDLDGDGKDELAATVSLTTPATRDAFLLAGRATWPPTLEPRSAPGWVERDSAVDPTAVALALGAGDVDGDGATDFVYGDPSYVVDDAPRGAIHLFRGRVALASGGLATSASTTFLGQDWFATLEPGVRRGFDWLGKSLGTGSDLNGDGLDDLVFAAPDAPDGGRVYLWLGRRAP